METKFKFEKAKQPNLIRVLYKVGNSWVKVAHYASDTGIVNLLRSSGIENAISDRQAFKDTISSLVQKWLFDSSIFGQMSDEQYKLWQESLYIALVGAEIVEQATKTMADSHKDLSSGTSETMNLNNSCFKLKQSLIGKNGIIPPEVRTTIESIMEKVKNDAREYFHTPVTGD